MGQKDFIGVFDSGVGGLSVLRALIDELPHEDFVFFGDSANAPYGEKSPEEVLRLSRRIVDGMLAEGAKAIVIACNTATSAAAPTLRAEHPDVPIIGVEPALKPATLAAKHDRILVMATPMTVAGEKFQRLEDMWAVHSTVIAVPCVGLAARIEQGDFDAPDLHELLVHLVGEWAGHVDSVVLGCTHYPFIKKQIREVLGDIPFFDGGAGTARQTRRLLEQKGLLRDEDPQAPAGSIELRSSIDTPEEMALYHWLMEQPL